MQGSVVDAGSTDGRSRILVVEDETSAREALCALLTDAGYEAFPAADGAAGIAAFERLSPDLIITDLAMPNVGGFDVIRAVRETAGREDVPVIIVSANDDTPQRVQGLDLGADDFIAKPLDFDELLARVRRQLARGKRRRLLERESAADALTGVLNRRGVMEFLARELTRVADGELLAAVMVDLDDFKCINDSHGHLVGDLALCAVARQLEGAVRETDRVSRLGGDEFLVVIPSISAQSLATVLARLRDLTPIALSVSSTLTLTLSLSFGCACATPGDGVDALLERADRAMYSDKRRQRAPR